jgi:hypothetical protein
MSNPTPIDCVNIHGSRVSTTPVKTAKRPKREKPESYHNGWRVVGIPPGTLEAARAEFIAKQREAKAPKDWDEGNWLMNAKPKPVRSKPYEIPQAAQECAELAVRAGWLRVEVVELKKEAA